LKIPYVVQLKFLHYVTFATARALTAHFTLDCSVCCVLKAEPNLAQLKLKVKLYVCGVPKTLHTTNHTFSLNKDGDE
jgi:hypothetical protein